MIDNKMIEYQRRIAKLVNKIKILSDNGYNVDNYNDTIQNIINSCNNDVITIEQGNSQVQIKNMNADLIYDEAFRKLNELDKEIDSEKNYIKFKKTYESILELSNDYNIDDDNFNELDRTLSMGYYELSKLKITDLEKSKTLIELLYKACYHVIKLEICKYGYSKLLVKINNSNQGCEFLNNVIKEDLNKFNFEDMCNNDIKKRINELSKNGLDANLCDLDLIVRITIRDYPNLKNEINKYYESRTTDIEWNNSKLESKNNDKKDKLKIINKYKKGKIITGCTAILTSILVSLGMKSNIDIESNSNLYSEGSYSVIETYDTISNTTTIDNEYKINDTNVVIMDYGEVNDKDKREVKTYHLNTSVLDIEDINKINTSDLTTYDKETIKYDDTQLSKDSYKVIEKVIERDNTNTTQVLDDNKVKKHKDITSTLISLNSSILGVAISQLLFKRKESKIYKKDLEIIDNEINELVNKKEKLEDMYSELTKSNEVVKGIYNPYKLKRK